jgi:alkylhydroperoxidase family enzyme
MVVFRMAEYDSVIESMGRRPRTKDGRRVQDTAIPPIDFEDLPPPLADVLRPRVERLGYLGEFFRRAAHQPAALHAFQEFTEAGKAALGERLTEVVALTASMVLGNRYERNQHERLSVRQGRGRDWVAAVERLGPGGVSVLREDERDAQEVVLAVLRDRGRGARAVVEAYAERYGGAAAMALLLVIARYAAHAAVVNALELQPPVPSIFEDGFDGP